MLRLQLANRRRGKRPPPGEQLVEHQAKREDVAAYRDLASEQLLRRHVRRCSGTDITWLANHCQPEIHHSNATFVVEHHIGGLEIAMNDAALVCGGEPRTQ